MSLREIKICIVAGEASGDLLGSELIEELREVSKYLNLDSDIVSHIRNKNNDRNQLQNNDQIYNIDKSSSDKGSKNDQRDKNDQRSSKNQDIYKFVFYGVGGDKMSLAGCEMINTYEHLDHIGLEGIFMNFFKIIRKFYQVSKKIIELEPDIILTIDSGGFNFRLIKKLRKSKKLNKSKFIHYVAPTVWAYNRKRSKLIESIYDRLIMLYPFEEKYFSKMRSTVAGFDTIARINQAPWISNIAKIYNLSENDISIGILIGSRPIEIRRHLPVILDAIEFIRNRYNKDIKFFMLVHSRTLIDQIHKYCRDRKINLSKLNVIFPLDLSHKHHIMKMNSIIWSKCGTASLESIAYQVPIICFYKVGLITSLILRRKLSDVGMSFVMANILLNERVIPEFIQNNFNAKALFNCTINILKNYDTEKMRASTVFDRVVSIAQINEDESNRVLKSEKMDIIDAKIDAALFQNTRYLGARRAAIGVVEEFFTRA